MKNKIYGLECKVNEKLEQPQSYGNEVFDLKEIYSAFIPRFGTNHAKVYSSFLGNEIKDARRVTQETGLHRVLVYRMLADLVEFGLLKQTSTEPRLYFTEKPLNTFDRLIKRYERLFEQKRNELKKILMCSDTEKIEEYLIKLGPQTRLLNSKTKEPVKNANEIKSIKQLLEEMAEKESVACECAYKMRDKYGK